MLLFLVLAGNFQLPLCYILCTADNLIPCSLENKFEVSSCSGSLYVYTLPRSYHLAELPQVLVCYERTSQLLGSTECVLGSLLIELPGGGPSLASLPGCLTSLAYLAVLPLHPAWLSYRPKSQGHCSLGGESGKEGELSTWPCRCSVPNEA